LGEAKKKRQRETQGKLDCEPRGANAKNEEGGKRRRGRKFGGKIENMKQQKEKKLKVKGL